MSMKLGFMIEDRAYFQAFTSYLYKQEVTMLSIFYEAGSTVYQKDKIDLMIIEDLCLDKCQEVINGLAIPYLTVCNQALVSRQASDNPIYKYQAAPHLIKHIIDTLLAAGKGVLRKGFKNSNVTMFLGTQGGIGTTRYAQLAAYQEGIRGKSTFYFSYDAKDIGYEIYSEVSRQVYGLSDFLVHLLSGRDSSLHLDLMLATDAKSGVRYFNAIEHPADLEDFPKEILRDFIGLLKEEGKFETIILDAGRISMSDQVGLLPLCDHAILFFEVPKVERKDSYLRHLSLLMDQGLEKDVLVHAIPVDPSGLIKSKGVLGWSDELLKDHNGRVSVNTFSKDYETIKHMFEVSQYENKPS